MPSRAAAVRELVRRWGLASVGIKPAEQGVKSGDFGVFGTGDDHRAAPGKGGNGQAARADSARAGGPRVQFSSIFAAATARLKRASSRRDLGLRTPQALPTTMAYMAVGAPSSAQRGRLKTFTSASLSRFTTGAGVSLGATRPKNAIQLTTSRCNSPNVGTSGSAATRRLCWTPCKRAPACAGLHRSSSEVGEAVADHSAPGRRWRRSAPARWPRYGTCKRSVPVASLNCSPSRCATEP